MIETLQIMEFSPKKFDNPNYFVIPVVIFLNTRYNFKTMSTPMVAPFIMFAPIWDIFQLNVKTNFLNMETYRKQLL